MPIDPGCTPVLCTKVSESEDSVGDAALATGGSFLSMAVAEVNCSGLIPHSTDVSQMTNAMTLFGRLSSLSPLLLVLWAFWF